MKIGVMACMFAALTALSLIAPAAADCNVCHLVSKTATGAGKFDYVFRCIDPSSGDEVRITVSAGSDAEAERVAMTKC
jgi:hypothetical protein